MIDGVPMVNIYGIMQALVSTSVIYFGGLVMFGGFCRLFADVDSIFAISIVRVSSSKYDIINEVYFFNFSALSGILFPGKEEASYSSFRLWEATGSVIMYVVSPFLHNKLKIGFLFVLMVIGLLGYVAIEILERKSKKGLPQKLDFELVDDKSKNTKEDK